MKIGLRAGHSPNCKGAMEILDEQVEVRKIYNELAPMLQKAGHTVIDCNSNANTAAKELKEGTDRANANNCDIYITLHMNASNGAGNGTEIWLYRDSNEYMNKISNEILTVFQYAGFTNRGIKISTKLHDLYYAVMPSMIIEFCFCDNSHDIKLYKEYGAHGFAKAVAERFGYVEQVEQTEEPSEVRDIVLKKFDPNDKSIMWNLEEVNGQAWSGDTFFFKNAATGLYMDVGACSRDVGAHMCAYKKTGADNQQFKLVNCDFWFIKSYMIQTYAGTGYVLDNSYGKAVDGNPIIPYTMHRQMNQQWSVLNMENGNMVFINQSTGMALGVK